MLDSQEKKLNLKDWQSFYMKLDMSYGNIIASILQTIYKNKFNSFTSLIKSIEKNKTIVLTGEGFVEILDKFKELVKITPKLYISKEIPGRLLSEKNPSYFFSIKSDFILTLNFNYITGFSDEYINNVNKIIDDVIYANNNVIKKYLLKQISEGIFFISKDFISKEIYDSKIQYTNYIVRNIFDKFNIKKYSSLDSIIESNYILVDEKNISYIESLNVPFTTFHADKYITKEYQNLYRYKYNIGKGELNTKIIYLKADYFIESKNQTVYDLLIESIINNYLPNENKINDKERYDSFEFNIKNIDDIDIVDNTILDDQDIDNLDDLAKFDLPDEIQFDINKITRKKSILKALKNDKVPKHELDFINSIDIEKLNVKKTFVNIINYLSNPFLSTILNTSTMRILKQYIIINYGENLKESISEELIELTEKQLINLIQSRNSFFIEYFNFITQYLSEKSHEKLVLIETIIKNSSYFKNLVLKKYLIKPKKIDSKLFTDVIRSIGHEYFNFLDDGIEEDLVIIPYIKIKEFLIYLLSTEINSSWEKLSKFFNDILTIMDQRSYTAILGDNEIKMSSNYVGSYNIIIKNRKETNHFEIKKFDDIEFIFQDKEHLKLKDIIKSLYNLHEKTGFGFDSKKDYNKLLELYYKRCNDYSLYKNKDEEYEGLTNSNNAFVAFLKRLLFWIPKSLNSYHLFKTMGNNKEIVKIAKYHYIEDDQLRNLASINNEYTDVKKKIISFINTDKSNKEINKKNIVQNEKNQKTKKITPKVLERLNGDEKKLFDYLKDYLTQNKDVIFTHNSKLYDEKIVIYIKETKNKDKFSYIQDKSYGSKDINTLDEYVTKYSNISALIEKNYLIQKILINKTDELDKKVYVLLLSDYIIK